MNKSRAAPKVRVIRLEQGPVRKTVGAPPTSADPAPPPPQAWPQPIGSASATLAPTQAEPAASPVSMPHLAVVRAGSPAPGPVGAAPGAEPRVPRLPVGEVRVWPVKADLVAQRHAWLWARWALLVVLTGGLGLPWAVQATRRALWRHTHVAGRSLDDHQSPLAWALHGVLLTGLLAGVGLAWASDAHLGLVAASVLILVWPMWLFVRVRQRAHHLSWARRRMGFDGRSAQVYREVWPLMLGAWCLMWAVAAAVRWGRPELWCLGGIVLAGVAMVAPAVTWAWLSWRQKRLKLGPWGLWWSAPREGVVRLAWRTGVWAVLAAVFVAGLSAAAWGILRWCDIRLTASVALALVAWPVLLLGVAVRAYAQARLQNLVWGKTGNRMVRLRSKLHVAAYVRQQCSHLVLLTLTAGLYWPWAQLATHRMRLQALSVCARVEAEDLAAHWPLPT